jgi:hypothetical protein
MDVSPSASEATILQSMRGAEAAASCIRCTFSNVVNRRCQRLGRREK